MQTVSHRLPLMFKLRRRRRRMFHFSRLESSMQPFINSAKTTTTTKIKECKKHVLVQITASYLRLRNKIQQMKHKSSSTWSQKFQGEPEERSGSKERFQPRDGFQ